MAEQIESKLIDEPSIKIDLDVFHNVFKSICQNNSIPTTLNALNQLDFGDLKALTLVLLSSLASANRVSQTNVQKLLNHVTSVASRPGHLKPLLQAALANKPDNQVIWDLVSAAIPATPDSTPPPRPTATFSSETPWRKDMGGIVSSSEHRRNIDSVLKGELNHMYIGVPNFHNAYFGGVPDLEIISVAVFQSCKIGDDPLFRNGWTGWPETAKQDDVIHWFIDVTAKIKEFAKEYSVLKTRRRLLSWPNNPIRGSIVQRKLDIAFVDESDADTDSQCDWLHILIPGELKSNSLDDIPSKAGLDLARYAREVFAAQDTRRYVLGFTLCGSLMRIWEFDRSGGLASESFNLNEDGLQFVKTVVGFLSMNEEGLGFDPTITTSGDERYIEIQKQGDTKRIKLDEPIVRTRCGVGRATTCWKAHDEKNPGVSLVVKDSWQDVDRDEEGELLRKATVKKVVNVARYYHHETVVVNKVTDDILNNVRRGLKFSKATIQPGSRQRSSSRQAKGTSRSRQSRYERGSTAGVKRSSSKTFIIPPPSKRSCSESPEKKRVYSQPNREHRRVILLDYGQPIYMASSPAALLKALNECIEGHKSLYKAGILHRDISINNLMINEDPENPSWDAFIIDLDLAVEVIEERSSKADGKTGTRAFMAIGALDGEQHSFMHDLESFFWVLFWICIHYNGPKEGFRKNSDFDKWNYQTDDTLIQLKLGTVSDEDIFRRLAEENFTVFYQPLIETAVQLRKAVFPGGGRWKSINLELYPLMLEILSTNHLSNSAS